MRARHRGVLSACFAITALGCSPRGTTITVVPREDEGEILDVAALVATVNESDSSYRWNGHEAVIRTRKVLGFTAKAALREALEKAVALAPAPAGPALRFAITETSVRKLADIGLTPETARARTIDITVRRGWMEERRMELTEGVPWCCLWHVPIPSELLLDLPYDDSEDPLHPVGDPWGAGMVASTITPLHPGLQTVVKRAHRSGSRIMFDFTHKDDDSYWPVREASKREATISCLRRLVSAGGDAFFRSILFPGLAGRIASFSIEDTYW